MISVFLFIFFYCTNRGESVDEKKQVAEARRPKRGKSFRIQAHGLFWDDELIKSLLSLQSVRRYVTICQLRHKNLIQPLEQILVY